MSREVDLASPIHQDHSSRDMSSFTEKTVRHKGATRNVSEIAPHQKAGRILVLASALGWQLLFEVVPALQFGVALAAFQDVDAGRFEDLAGGEPAGGLLFTAGAEPFGQARRAGQGVGLQLAGDAVAPV